MRELHVRLDAALTDVGRATAALADTEARAGEARAEADAARQEVVAARAEAKAVQRHLASSKAAAEVLPWCTTSGLRKRPFQLQCWLLLYFETMPVALNMASRAVLPFMSRAGHAASAMTLVSDATLHVTLLI